MVAVPHELQEELNLAEGDSVALTREGKELLVDKPLRYSLEQLLSEHSAIAGQLEDDRAWMDAPRVGRELI